MKVLGYGDQPYIVFKHNDTSRKHIHIVSPQVGNHRQKIDNRFEKRWSKRITDVLEKRLGLIPSSKITDEAMKRMLRVDISRGNIEKQVIEILRSILKHYKFYSSRKLNTTLSVYSLAMEEVKMEFQGKRYEGLIYIPTDDRGDGVSSPIHVLGIRRGVGYTAAQNRM